MQPPFDPSAWTQGTGHGLPFPLLKLTEGTYRVRILDARPARREIHFDSIPNKVVTCPGTDQGCLFCARGDKLQLRHYVNVLDRQDGRVKVLRYPHIVAERLAEVIAVDGDPRLYDVQITRTGHGIADTTYAVVKAGETGPLTIGPLQTFDIEAVLTPMPVEDMRTRLNQPVTTANRKIRDFYADQPAAAGNPPATGQDQDVPV